MFEEPSGCLLPDGKRFQLRQGPIDLIIQAFGAHEQIGRAYETAEARFQTILINLTKELGYLRTDLRYSIGPPKDPVAQRMVEACKVHQDNFVTPMAAVAGAVADEILDTMIGSADLTKAYVNNGGDIAFHLSRGRKINAGIVGSLELPKINATCEFLYEFSARGIATSGWRGRSYSLGIADSVTVLAKNAASADVAATLIANNVNVDHAGIVRTPAYELNPDHDLKDRLVTRRVPKLEKVLIWKALDRGQTVAQSMLEAGLIDGSFLYLQEEFRTVGEIPGGKMSIQYSSPAQSIK